MSGSQMMKNKEDVAAIMKAKQQAGKWFQTGHEVLGLWANYNASGREKSKGGVGQGEEVDSWQPINLEF